MTGSLTSDWKTQLSDILPLFGHRNWIVVADSAFPAQSKPGIETIVSGADQLHVVQHVLDAIAACSHVRANVYADRELTFVPEIDAPGIEDYRKQLGGSMRTGNAPSSLKSTRRVSKTTASNSAPSSRAHAFSTSRTTKSLQSSINLPRSSASFSSKRK